MAESNVESLLTAILKNDEQYVVVPQSRVEELLLAIYRNGGGGSGGGVTPGQLEDALKTKVDVKKGYSLVNDTEIARLSKVDNYDDKYILNELGKKVSKADGKSLIDVTDYNNLMSAYNKIGDANGLATLDANKKVTASQLPDIESYRLFEITNPNSAIKAYKLQKKTGSGEYTDISGSEASAVITIPDSLAASLKLKTYSTDISGEITKTDSIETAFSKLVNALNDKANKTELSSSVGAVYKTYGCKSLWSIDEKTLTAAGYIYNSYINSAYKTKLQPGKYKLTIKSDVAATMQFSFVLYSDTTKKTTVTFNAVVGANVVDITNLYETDFIQLYTQKAGTYTEIAIIPEGVSAEPYVPYAPTNRELQTNLLSTIVASSNASASNSKTLEFQGTGKALEKLVIEGKTVQDGTPSPSAPVEVKGVGDKSRNLFKITVPGSSNGVTITPNADTGEVTFSGTSNSGASYSWSATLQLEAGTYTLIPNANRIFTVQIFKNSAYFSNHSSVGSSLTITLTEKASYSFRAYFSANASANLITKPMLVKEGVSTEFEQYYEGYKIPISVAGKSSNIYLNEPLYDGEILNTESGSVDKIKKLFTLTGDETWTLQSTNSYGIANFKTTLPVNATSNGGTKYSNRFVNQTSVIADTKTPGVTISNNTDLYIRIQSSVVATVDAMKAWLKANPTYVIYGINATKETFDAPEISTAVGKNTLTVETEITPAKVEVTSFGEYYSKSEVDKMLAKKTDNVDTGWYDVDLSKAIMNNSGTSIVNESSNRLRFRRIGDVVYFDVRLKFDNSNTNNVMLSFWFESVAKEFIPIRSQVHMIRSAEYNSDNDSDTHDVWIQFTAGDNIALSFFRPENIKFNTVSGKTIIGTGCYIVN